VPTFSINGHDAVWMGPLPPGDTQLRVGFVLPYHENEIELVQPTPIPFDRLALVTQQMEGLSVSGNGLHGEAREMQGRKLMVYFGDGTSRNGELKLHVSGLPQTDATPRRIAAVVSIALIVLFGFYAARGQGSRRAQLERERRDTLASLIEVEDELVGREHDSKNLKRRDTLTAKLADIYRDLDELGGG
jgi:hypothetical protein